MYVSYPILQLYLDNYLYFKGTSMICFKYFKKLKCIFLSIFFAFKLISKAILWSNVSQRSKGKDIVDKLLYVLSKITPSVHLNYWLKRLDTDFTWNQIEPAGMQACSLWYATSSNSLHPKINIGILNIRDIKG